MTVKYEDIEERYEMRKRLTALFTVLCMAVSFLPSFALPAAAAEEASDYTFGTNVLKNPTPTSDAIWTLKNCSYGGFYDPDNSDKQIFGAHGGKNISVSQTVTLKKEDVIRANNGELYVSASGKFYAQGSRTLTANLNIICYDSLDRVVENGTFNNKYSGFHAIYGKTHNLAVGKSKIPAGTTRIVYEGVESLDVGGAWFGMFDFSMIFYDSVAPTVVKDPYLYSVNGSTAFPEYVVPGDKVTYAMKFSEAINKVVDYPQLCLMFGKSKHTIDRSYYDTTYSEDRQTAYFTFKLPNNGTNCTLNFEGIIGLTASDDAGNEAKYTKDGLAASSIPYKSVFDVTYNLKNLTTNGSATAGYGNHFVAELTPNPGYRIPSGVSVKVRGKDLTRGSSASNGGYTYSGNQILIFRNYVAGDIEITAVGIPETYTVTFDMQGGSGGTQKVSADYLTQLPNITPPERTGYIFGGYYTEENGRGTLYYSETGKTTKTYREVGNITLYAKWIPREYAVTLNAMGGTNGGVVTAVYDADMPSIAMSVKKGYTFLGYFTKENGGGDMYYTAAAASARKYDKTDALTLYADWGANKYTVILDMQGGSGGTQSISAEYDSKMPSVTPPVREGYTFGGYYAGKNGSGLQYYFADGEGAKAYDVDSECTLYAKWTANTYDVVLNPSGGSGGSTVTATFDSDMPVIAAPDKPGYLFEGYYDGENGEGKKYYNADCTSANVYDRAQSITLYAKWSPVTYDIQLYSRGKNVGTLKDVVFGKLRLPNAESINITYPNYNFVGWNIYDEQNWAMYTADREYAAGLVTEQGKTAYIYAAWLEKDKFTVTYDANGGEGAPSAQEVHVDETISISSVVPSRANYTFAGWSEKSDSDTAQYRGGDSFTMGNSLVTLFAVWNKNPELIYNANGGVFSTYVSAAYPPAGSLVRLSSAVPQKEGYTFVGWAESETATKADVITSLYTMPDKDTVLYAVYEPVKYTVSVSLTDGYTVSGISADGYMLGDYAEFTVSGASPKVYINGTLAFAADGVYRVQIKSDTSVVVCDTSSVNVIYNANGGVNAPVDMRVYTNGDTVSVKSDLPSKAGYDFVGWATDKDFDTAQYSGGDSILIDAEDIVLYAVWKPITYIIKYDSNGGSGDMDASTAVYDTVLSLKENTFTKTGCQFAGWSDAPDGEITYTDGASVKNLTAAKNGEVTLYAVWKGAKTRINFNFEGGSSGTSFTDAVYGKILPSDKLLPPSRYGYTFAGYYTLPNKGGNSVYNTDMSLSDYYSANAWDITSDKFELYAAWEPLNYTVTFVNGTKTLGTISAVYGRSFYLPKADELGIVVPEGYTFCGWSVASGSDTVYYSDGQEIATGLSIDSQTAVHLYAVILKSERYTVTIPASGEGYKVYYNDICVTALKNITVNKGENISFKVCVDEGYNFDKMTVSANGILLGATYAEGNAYTYTLTDISCDTSVNIYDVKKETFRIILNDGTGYTVSPKNSVVNSGDDFSFTVALAEGYKTASPVVFADGNRLSGTRNGDVFTYTVSNVTSQPVISVSVVSKPLYTVTFVSNGSIYLISTVEENMKVTKPAAPERAGHTFDGWYKDSAYLHPYDFMTEVTEDVRLYAKWTADTYTVKYDKNTSDDVSVPAEQTKSYGEVLVLSHQVPERTGYTFIEWNTKADGTGTSYGAGSELSVNAFVTLYAQWRINKFSVTLITGDGVTGTISANEVEYNKTVEVTAESGDGYAQPVITAVPSENAELVSDGLYRIKGPVSFIATAKAKKIYTASFYLDGGLYYVQSAIEGSGETVVLPNPPSKQGYRFTGWYTEENGGSRVDETTALDKNFSAYARFELKTLNVTPPADGIGYTVDLYDSSSVNYGDSYTFAITVADHYNADNMKVYANGILLVPNKNGNVYTFTAENITDDVLIYMHGITADIYTVKYTVDGEVGHSESVVYNGKAQKPKSPVKTGYVFTGWFAGDDEYDFESQVESDIYLEAKFEPVSYRISVPDSSSEFTVNVTSENPVAHGETFSFNITLSDGYNASDMLVYASGVLLEKTYEDGSTLYFDITNVTEAKVITIRGVGQSTYSVTYNSNTADYVGNMPENTVKTYDTDVTVSDLIPERYGYKFIGWAADKDGAAAYPAGSLYCENADIKLYAVWEAMTYSVSYEANGGFINSGEISEYTYGEGAVLPTDILRDGYDFAGWYEDELMQGVRVYEIKKDDCGDKKYYAAYTVASINMDGYTGEYDGKEHIITYNLADNLSAERYQWYFVPSGSNSAVAVSSDSYNTYAVKDVSESGEYYCCIEVLSGGYVTRYFTQSATVEISKRPVTVKAADSSGVYDALPLSSNEAHLADGHGLADGHKLSAAMTADSTITNAGETENKIEKIVISDSENNDVTSNYEITTQNGTLSVTPLTLTVTGKDTSAGYGTTPDENSMCNITGVLADEKLSLANVSTAAKDENGAEVAFSEITKNNGVYTVTISYNGFDGEGSKNYQGSGTITATVTVYRKGGGSGSGSGGSGGGGGKVLPSAAYTVDFNTDGGSKVESRSVKSGECAKEPQSPEKEGYTFDGWYTDGNLSDKFDFTAKITKNITLYAKWSEDDKNREQNPSETAVANPWETGVAKHLETEKHIGYLIGSGDNTFKPESNMTRAEAAQMFYNLLIDKNTSGEAVFGDVNADDWYFDAVAALAGRGIVKGSGKGIFNPEGEITRAEFIAMAMRFVDIDVSGTKTFSDVSDDHWAAKNISDAAELGWISGNGDGTFGPDAFIKRAAVAKIVNNMLARKADAEYINGHSGSIKLFSDVSSSKWYYEDVAEAANTHEYEMNGGAENWK